MPAVLAGGFQSSVGRSDGRHWGGLVTAGGEIRWPPMGRISWPPTSAAEPNASPKRSGIQLKTKNVCMCPKTMDRTNRRNSKPSRPIFPVHLRDPNLSRLFREQVLRTFVSVRILPIACLWIAVLIARVSVFAGGGLGGWLSVRLFWIASAGLTVIAVLGIHRSRGARKAPYILLVVGLVAFVYRVVVPNGLGAELSTAIWLLCATGLTLLGVQRAIQGRRTAS